MRGSWPATPGARSCTTAARFSSARAIRVWSRTSIRRGGAVAIVSRRRDRFEATSGGAIAGTLFFWHTALSLGTRVPLAVGAWALGFGLLALGVWLPTRRGGRKATLRAGAALLVVALAVGTSVGIELNDRMARDAAVIVADEVALRTGDGTSYPERYENPVHAGAEVRVVEERAGWADIELPDGKRGWIPIEAVERV